MGHACLPRANSILHFGNGRRNGLRTCESLMSACIFPSTHSLQYPHVVSLSPPTFSSTRAKVAVLSLFFFHLGRGFCSPDFGCRRLASFPSLFSHSVYCTSQRITCSHFSGVSGQGHQRWRTLCFPLLVSGDWALQKNSNTIPLHASSFLVIAK